MQKDFAAMAQQAPAQQEPDIMGALPSMEAMGKAGLPTGGSPEDMKKRVMSLLQSIGVLEMYKTAEQKQQLEEEVNQIIQAIEEKNVDLLSQIPLFQKIQELMPQEQAAPQQDFASMVPGGGMGGR